MYANGSEDSAGVAGHLQTSTQRLCSPSRMAGFHPEPVKPTNIKPAKHSLNMYKPIDIAMDGSCSPVAGSFCTSTGQGS